MPTEIHKITTNQSKETGFFYHYITCNIMCVTVNQEEMNMLQQKCQLVVYRSVIGKMSLSVKQSLLGRLRTLLKRMHVG